MTSDTNTTREDSPTPAPNDQGTAGSQEPALSYQEPVISVKNVSKVYKNILGLNNITLNIYPGITGLLGPNGAGKSTLLKIIANLVKQTQGTVSVLGKKITQDPYLFARIGYVSETDSLYPDMTGREYVGFFLRLHGIADEEADRRARLMLNKLELTDDMGRKVNGYSKGMKQKVKIARALAFDPDIILLDEPLNGTDPETRSLIIENIRHWGEIGKTVILSSHILHEIERVTTNIVLLNKGRIYAVGDVSRLRSMMDEHPHKVEIELFEEKGLRELASLLIKQDYVGSATVKLSKKKLIVTSSKPADFFKEFPKLVSGGSSGDEQLFKIRSMYSTDDNLQSLYHYLMDKRGW